MKESWDNKLNKAVLEDKLKNLWNENSNDKNEKEMNDMVKETINNQVQKILNDKSNDKLNKAILDDKINEVLNNQSIESWDDKVKEILNFQAIETFNKRLNKAMAFRNLKQVDLVEKTGLSKSAISQYISGKFDPKQKGTYLLAKALDVNEAWLMGHDVPMDRVYTNKIETHKIPLLGNIACGMPILSEENHECYVAAGENIRADFCLKVKGDSMINARIWDGDIVFIKQQSDVEDGEIAAVLIDDEATLKRVFKMPGRIQLRAENPNFKTLDYKESDGYNIRILGKAIAFQGDIK